MTLAQAVVAGLALWGTWDLGRRLLDWSDPDDSTDRWQRRRRALTDVTRGRPVDPCDGGNQPHHHPGGPEWD